MALYLRPGVRIGAGKVNTWGAILRSFGSGWRLWATWGVSILILLTLTTVRVDTYAEFSFASLALLPVAFIAWVVGQRAGLLAGILAAAMWIISDMMAERQYSAAWIRWVNALTHIATYCIVAHIVAQVRLKFELEHDRALQDNLTGLPNQRAFYDAGASEVERSMRYAHHLTVIFIDLDNFKQLNDTRGHDSGDAALKAVGEALVGSVRSNDRLARLGGDEFAVLLPEIGGNAAEEAGLKIFAAVKRALQDFPPTGVSIGVAWFNKADRPFSAIMKAADELMYEVKEGGKGNLRSRHYRQQNK